MRSAALLAVCLAVLSGCSAGSGARSTPASSGGNSSSSAGGSSSSSSGGGSSSSSDGTVSGSTATIGSSFAPGDESFLVQVHYAPPGSGSSSGSGSSGSSSCDAFATEDPAETRAVHALSTDGTRLYALDAFRGFQIFTLANLDAPALAGRIPVTGKPVDLYLRGSTAFLTLTDTVAWSPPAGAGAPGARRGAQLWAVDVADPAAPRVVSRVELGGGLVESRLVGNVLYAVSRWDSSWWSVGTPATDHLYLDGLDLADPAAPRAVARVELDNTGYLRTYAELTDQRITIARVAVTADADATYFQVYDLSGADGALTKGATFWTMGGLLDRRAMRYDADRKVFAAVLGRGIGGGAALHLWSSPTPDTATPAGSTALRQGETLVTARLDGVRAYVLTVGDAPRLYVVDATDPAHPAVSPQPLLLPGVVTFMEPRGDRLLVLGTSAGPGERWTLSLSLVGASATDPQLLGSAVVGEQSRVSSEGGDDLSSSFQVLDADGLVAVPASSWNAESRCWQGHVALVDLSPQGLTARGRLAHPGRVARVAPVPGQPGQLALLGTGRLAVADATNRAAPRVRGELDPSRPVNALAFAGGKAVALAGAGVGAELRVADALAPDGAPLARLGIPGAWRLHAAGSIVWVLGWGPGYILTAVDVADPLHPRVRSTLDLSAATEEDFSRGSCGTELDFLGTALVMHRITTCSAGTLPEYVLRPLTAAKASSAPGAVLRAAAASTSDVAHDLFVFDLSSPDAPRLAGRLALPGAAGWGLTVSGGFAWVTHWEWEPGDGWLGRYFADRLDVTTPATPTLLSVNVPGVLVAAEAGGKRLYVREPIRWENARDVWFDQTDLHALELTERGTARLVATANLAGAHEGTAFAGGRAYVATDPHLGSAQLAAVDLATMSIASQQPLPTRVRRLAAAGGKLVVGLRDGASDDHAPESALVYGLADSGRPSFERGVSISGWMDAGMAVVVESGTAYLPGGAYGVAAIPLAP